MKKLLIVLASLALAISFVACPQRGGSSQKGGGDSEDEWLSGEFSVSENKKVRFTKGNLYWDGSDFKIEDNQYDFRTWSSKNSVIDGAYNATGTPENHVGLFFWSHVKEKTYAENFDDPQKDSADTFALANGGAINGYDVLSIDEWIYLLDDQNPDRATRFGLATITDAGDGGVAGLVMLPDNWTSAPSGLSWNSGYSNGFSTNNYTKKQWVTMENAGAVFLPATGRRGNANQQNGSVLFNTGTDGYYWSSSSNSNSLANDMGFYSSAINNSNYYQYRDSGHAIRLVKVV